MQIKFVQFSYSYILAQVLRRNPLKDWVTSGLKLFTKIIENFFATLLNIFSKEIISNNTKCRKEILK